MKAWSYIILIGAQVACALATSQVGYRMGMKFGAEQEQEIQAAKEKELAKRTVRIFLGPDGTVESWENGTPWFLRFSGLTITRTNPIAGGQQ